MNRFRRALTACCCVALLAACNVRVHASVSLNADGTGRVSAVVELDKDAATLAKRDAGSLAQAIRLDDLKRSGWTVGEWTERDGAASLRVERETKSPAETRAAMEQLGGGVDGVVVDVDVQMSSGPLQNDTKLAYSVDLSRLKLTDPDSVSRLQAVGLDANAVTDLAAHRANGAFRLDVTTDLPVDDPVTDSFPWGDSRRITRETTEYHPGQAGLMVGGGLLVLLGLVGFVAPRRRAALRQRRGRGPQRRSIT